MIEPPMEGFGELGRNEKWKSRNESIDSSASSNRVTGSEKSLKNIEKSGKIEPGKDYADGLGKSNIYRADERIDKAVEKSEVEVTIGGKAKIKIVQMGKDETEIDTLTSKWEKHVNPKNFDRIGTVEIINSPLEDLISAMGVRGYYGSEKHDIVLTRYLSLDRKIKVEDMALTSLHEIGHHVYSKILEPEQRNEVSVMYGFLKDNVYDTPPKSEAEWYADCARSYFLKDGKLKLLDAKMAGVVDVGKPGFSVSDMLKRQLE